MTLWALSRSSTGDVIAAPSYEAAEAACLLPGDTVQPWTWPWLPQWHAEQAASFLECVDGVYEQ